jgi:hypothetical protein
MVVILHLGAIQCLTALLKGESASFQKMDPNALLCKTYGKNKPRNAAPDQTHRRVERMSNGRLFEVDMHGLIIGRKSLIRSSIFLVEDPKLRLIPRK